MPLLQPFLVALLLLVLYLHSSCAFPCSLGQLPTSTRSAHSNNPSRHKSAFRTPRPLVSGLLREEKAACLASQSSKAVQRGAEAEMPAVCVVGVFGCTGSGKSTVNVFSCVSVGRGGLAICYARPPSGRRWCAIARSARVARCEAKRRPRGDSATRRQS